MRLGRSESGVSMAKVQPTNQERMLKRVGVVKRIGEE